MAREFGDAEEPGDRGKGDLERTDAEGSGRGRVGADVDELVVAERHPLVGGPDAAVAERLQITRLVGATRPAGIDLDREPVDRPEPERPLRVRAHLHFDGAATAERVLEHLLEERAEAVLLVRLLEAVRRECDLAPELVARAAPRRGITSQVELCDRVLDGVDGAARVGRAAEVAQVERRRLVGEPVRRAQLAELDEAREDRGLSRGCLLARAAPEDAPEPPETLQKSHGVLASAENEPGDRGFDHELGERPRQRLDAVGRAARRRAAPSSSSRPRAPDACRRGGPCPRS